MTLLGQQIGTVWPWAATGLIALALFAVLLRRRLVVRDQRRVALGVHTSGKRLSALLLAITPAFLLCLAATRPYAGKETIEMPSADTDYMFLVDVSRSMLAKDIPPSRMDVAKRKMKDLLQAFTKAGIARRFGITVFSGGVYTICPLTDDTSAVIQFIDSISPDLVTSVGSNLEQGVVTVLERLKESQSRSGRVLLISDGEDNALNLERVVSVLRGSKVPVDVLGVGTLIGSPIELTNGKYVRDKSGNIVHSKLNEQSLELIAKAGNGTYVRATIPDKDIDALVAAGTPLVQSSSSGNVRQVTSYREVGSWLALAALVVVLLLAAFHRQGFALTIFLLCGVCLDFASAQATPEAEGAAQASGRAAFEQYHAGDFAKAATIFRQALQDDPGNRALEQGLASALFKSGNYTEAQQVFRKLADTAKSGRQYFENTYNEGNSWLAMRRYPEAIEAFTKALDVKPDDEQALHNREVARKLLEEAKRATPTPTPTATPTAMQSQSPSAAPSPSVAPSPSSAPSPSVSPSPSAAPSASAAPSGQPSAHPSAQSSPAPGNSGGPTTSPTAEGSATGASNQQPEARSKTPQPTPEASASAAPPSPPGASPAPTAAERLKEARDPVTATPFSGKAGGDPTEAYLDPSVKEAETWLKSLPEAPLLLRRDKARRDNPDQTW